MRFVLMSLAVITAWSIEAAAPKRYDAHVEAKPAMLRVVDGQKVVFTITVTNTGEASWSRTDLAKAPQVGYGLEAGPQDRSGHKLGFNSAVDRMVAIRPLVRGDQIVRDRIDLWRGHQSDEIKPGEKVVLKVGFRFERKKPTDGPFTEGIQLIWDSGKPSDEWADGWVGNTAIVTYAFVPSKPRPRH